jgi:hypothetical protein
MVILLLAQSAVQFQNRQQCKKHLRERTMNLVVYADESGTHDKTGSQKGSREAIVGGIVAPTEDWAKFRNSWQAVLNRYSAPYFHFSEWSTASAVARNKRTPSVAFQKNPFRGWKLESLDALLLDLAKVAGSGNKVIVGASVFTKDFHQEKLSGNIPDDANPYAYCLDQFFAEVLGNIQQQRAPWKRTPLSFVFDQSDNLDWVQAIQNSFACYKAKYRTFTTLAFADKKDPQHLPFQAADMVAYRARQITSLWVEGEPLVGSPELAEALFKSTFDFLNTHKDVVLRAHLYGALDYEYYKRHG